MHRFKSNRAVAVLFVGFIIITVAWNTGNEKLEQYFDRYNQRGLRIVIRAVKEELLALGLISLILTGLKVSAWVDSRLALA